MRIAALLLTTALSSLVLTACSRDEDPELAAKSAEWRRGRATYLANCVACHNPDPSKEGPIGPAIRGSSEELLEARVLSTTYPEGYQPKRPTKVMPQFPFIKNEIPYLAAYIR
jgi:mono/diheme cytochrome c family protein